MIDPKLRAEHAMAIPKGEFVHNVQGHRWQFVGWKKPNSKGKAARFVPVIQMYPGKMVSESLVTVAAILRHFPDAARFVTSDATGSSKNIAEGAGL